MNQVVNALWPKKLLLGQNHCGLRHEKAKEEGNSSHHIITNTTTTTTMSPTPHSLDQVVQQSARDLHAHLASELNNQQLCGANSPTEQELSQLTASNAQLARAISSAAAAAPAPDDADELAAACSQRQELLQDLLQTLDGAVLGLRAQLDACHKLLRTAPVCKARPDAIIRYAHTLRHGFAPLGAAHGVPQVPPAPQLPFMLCSTLRMYNMDLAAQQQQQAGGPAGAGAGQPPPAALLQPMQLPPSQPPSQQQPDAAGVVAPDQATAAGAAAAAAPPPPPAAPIIDFMLNQDLGDDFSSSDGLGSQVSEQYSEDEESSISQL